MRNIRGRGYEKTKTNGSLENMHSEENSSRSLSNAFWRHNTTRVWRNKHSCQQETILGSMSQNENLLSNWLKQSKTSTGETVASELGREPFSKKEKRKLYWTLSYGDFRTMQEKSNGREVGKQVVFKGFWLVGLFWF